MAKRLFQRVADEARPPAILGRPGCGPPDYFTDVLLDDLVESGAWLDLELKRPFLALWVNEGIPHRTICTMMNTAQGCVIVNKLLPAS